MRGEKKGGPKGWGGWLEQLEERKRQCHLSDISVTLDRMYKRLEKTVHQKKVRMTQRRNFKKD